MTLQSAQALLVVAMGMLAMQAGVPAGKVVVLRDAAVVSANADGSNVRTLVQDDGPKTDPRWSPDGGRIAYLTNGNTAADPKSHAIFVVIDAQGARVATVPVLSTIADGTEVSGLRFVESGGWHSRSSLFARGSVNPYKHEYRILQLSGRVEDSYFGDSFVTCAGNGQVAYMPDAGEAGEGIVNINSTRAYGRSAADASVGDLHWSQNCDRLMLVEQRGGTSTLVVLRNRAVEARRQLPASLNERTIYETRDAFVFESPAAVLAYDPASRSLKPGDALLRQIKAERAERDKVVQTLGGTSADWWIAPTR